MSHHRKLFDRWRQKSVANPSSSLLHLLHPSHVGSEEQQFFLIMMEANIALSLSPLICSCSPGIALHRNMSAISFRSQVLFPRELRLRHVYCQKSSPLPPPVYTTFFQMLPWPFLIPHGIPSIKNITWWQPSPERQHTSSTIPEMPPQTSSPPA